MGALPILVLDDDPATAKVATSTLGPRGYAVTATSEPEEAIKLANRLVPELLLVNPVPLKLKGTHFVRVLRTRPATALIPTIFFSDPKFLIKSIAGFQLGSDGFMTKPIVPQELEAQVKRSLEERAKAEKVLHPQGGSSVDFSVAPTNTAFRGSLEQIALPSLLTLLEMERKSGMLVLILDPESEKARLHVRNGQLIRARLDARGEPGNADLVYDLLARTKGKFDFRPQSVEGDDEIKSPLATLLLEGARRMDEGRQRPA